MPVEAAVEDRRHVPGPGRKVARPGHEPPEQHRELTADVADRDPGIAGRVAPQDLGPVPGVAGGASGVRRTAGVAGRTASVAGPAAGVRRTAGVAGRAASVAGPAAGGALLASR